MMSRVFVDTWAWIALMYAKDPYHPSALKQHLKFRQQNVRYVTTDYVLSETITSLFAVLPFADAERFMSGTLQAFQNASTYQLEHITPLRFHAAWTMRRQYADKPDISFVDLTSMAVMRELGITEVFTGDAHFRKVNLGFRLLPADAHQP
jgi:predicted nucleic acid-binding protein